MLGKKKPWMRDQAPVAPQQFLVRAPKTLELGVFLSIGANDADAGQCFLRHGADF